MAQEAEQLTKMREQMESNKRFGAHYAVLGENEDAILYLDKKIEDNFSKKMELIARYSQVSLTESGAIIDGQISAQRKDTCDKLKLEIDKQLKLYDAELASLQERRSALLTAHTELQEYLLGQEKARNERLDSLYTNHSNLLEKLYLRHSHHTEEVAKKTLSAGTSTYKSIVLAPLQFLMQYFNLSSSISLEQAEKEAAARKNIEDLEDDINDTELDPEENKDEYNSDDEDNESNQDEDTDSHRAVV